MMRWIVGSSLKFRFLVIAAAAAMMYFGVERLRTMPVDVFPEFAPPIVEIQTEGIGMTATEVEELITGPMEEQLRGTPELDVLRSKSVVGLSAIRLIFKMGTDVLHARQLVQERLEQAVHILPRSAGAPIMLQPLSATSRAMKIGITSKEHSLMDLSMIAYWTIKFRLLQVPGVANVPIWGERIKLLAVLVDPEKLRKYDVSLNDVEKSVGEALEFSALPYSKHAKLQTEGFIDTPNQRLALRYVLPVIEAEDLSRVPIDVHEGKTVLLRDVAEVKWETWPMIGDAVINGGPGLMMIVEKLPWANTLDVTRGVEEALAALKPGLQGVQIDAQIFRPATFIEMALHNLTAALLIGCVLVIVVLGAFLYEWRAALISVVAIPLSLMAGALVLYVRGTTINTMVLAGFVIAVGVVVDDAIIDIENIVRRLRQYRREGSTKSVGSVILEASLEVRSAIVYATLIDAVTLLPVFLMEGLSGSFFKPLALSYALAVLASMVVALTVTPALGFILLSNTALERRESPITRWLQHRYEALLTRIIRTPRPAFITVCVIVLAGAVVYPRLGQSLLPNFKERDFLMHWVTTPGTSHPEMVRVTEQACRELISIPGVRNCGSHVGRAITGDEPYGVNFTENWISVDPKVDYDKTLAKVQELVDGYPGLYRDVQTYLKERIKEVLTGAKQSIVVRTYGPDLEVLRHTAADVERALGGIPGLVDLKAEVHRPVPQVEVKVDLASANQHGLKPGDVRRAAATIVSGIEVSDIHRDGKVYDVWVWSKPEARRSVTDIQNLVIDTPKGGHVRLAEVADVSVKPTPDAIEHEGLSRRHDVGGNVRGRDLGSVVGDVERRLRDVKFPLGYRAEVLGEYAERQAAQRHLLTFSVAAVIGVYLLLVTSFGSWRLATLSFLTLPSALVGGVLAAYFADGVISLGSLVGFFTILGIAARNGIMMINHFQHLERHEGEAFGPGLVVRGARERLSPILMTTLACGLAIVPLVVAGNIPGNEIEHPLAIVVLGGLVTSTLLNLFVVPSLYLRFGKSRAQPA
ncbi:MAG: acriflavin resistance protein [Candidatus Rokubacteria bacterium 13_1_20CM_4_68_9]|nr:MAG: acriflavin resistance protein [Candidatus Rokubacteria bacterium 13_1_40CM_4_67_11]OLD97588.1 MAG: acriflavin resistance protein [Candidatus Rokubacteria bacterium 13_1_20CM_4_68_9]PYN59753.1 MAG: acriflavin resistance protein [Candidatus Rokubacteria bacterium]